MAPIRARHPSLLSDVTLRHSHSTHSSPRASQEDTAVEAVEQALRKSFGTQTEPPPPPQPPTFSSALSLLRGPRTSSDLFLYPYPSVPPPVPPSALDDPPSFSPSAAAPDADAPEDGLATLLAALQARLESIRAGALAPEPEPAPRQPPAPAAAPESPREEPRERDMASALERARLLAMVRGSDAKSDSDTQAGTGEPVSGLVFVERRPEEGGPAVRREVDDLGDPALRPEGFPRVDTVRAESLLRATYVSETVRVWGARDVASSQR